MQLASRARVARPIIAVTLACSACHGPRQPARPGAMEVTELSQPPPASREVVAAAFKQWHTLRFHTTFTAGQLQLERWQQWDIEATEPDGLVVVMRQGDRPDALSPAWERQTLTWDAFQLANTGDVRHDVQRTRVTFEYDNASWEGWRYDWTPDHPSIDRFTAWYADERPGPPLRLQGYVAGVLKQQTDLIHHEPSSTLPPPYTAEQIRADMPSGTGVTLRTTNADGLTSYDHWEVTQATESHATIRYSSSPTIAPNPSDPQAFDDASAWIDLRDHAAFPQFAADRVRETFVTSLGTFHGWRYIVPSRGNDGDTYVHTYWFADRPAGPPMVHTVVSRGMTLQRVEQVRRSR